MSPALLWAALRALPWRYVLPALALALLAWRGYAWVWERGHRAGLAEMQPAVLALRAEIDADDAARREALSEDVRRQNRYDERNDEIAHTAAARRRGIDADADRLHEWLQHYVDVGPPADRSASANPGTAAGVCTLDAAGRELLRAHAADFEQLARDADRASTAAAECTERFDALVQRLAAHE